MVNLITNPAPTFLDASGNALNTGSAGGLYIGVANVDPTKNPISVYQDDELSIPFAQPLQVVNGVVSLNGSPRQVFTSATVFSLAAFDQSGSMVLSMPEVSSVGQFPPITSMVPKIYKAGTDFTPGTSTTLALASDPGSADNVLMFFDATFQSPDQIQSVAYPTLTLTSPIPVGTQEVILFVGATFATGTPGAGSVTDASVAASAGIQSSKLAYNEGGTAAITRTVQSRLQDIVSVMDFGATGNGTTDDSGAIQAAINAVSTSSSLGGMVYFPKGTYLIKNTINVPTLLNDDNWITLMGVGRGSQIIPGATLSTLFNVTGGNVTIERLFFNNANSYATTGVTATFPSSNAGYSMRFQQNSVIGFNTNGLLCSGQNFDINENWFQGSTNNINFSNDGRNTSISDNYFLGGNNGIYMNTNGTYQAEGLRVTNNTILSTGGNGSGITLLGGLEVFIGHNIIDQTGANSQGIYINPAAGNAIDKVKIIGNWICAGASAYGIYTGGNNSEIDIIGNSFVNGGASVYAINLNNTNGYKLISNNFHMTIGGDFLQSGAVNGDQMANFTTLSGSPVIPNIFGNSVQAPVFTTSGTPTITGGTGVPTSVQPNGSLYLRLDGGTGGRLYVSAGGGTWAGVSGV